MYELLWSTGGFTAGCLIGAFAANSVYTRKTTTDLDLAIEPLQNCQRLSRLGNDSGISKEDVFSNMTLLLGSPTASALLETGEFPLYNASENYPDLDGNRSLMARYLTKELYGELHQMKTSSGFNLDSCIQTGVDNPEKISCGIVAGDEECYDIFADIFDPVITNRHRGFQRGVKYHEGNLSVGNFSAPPFDPIYVKSTHFLVSRCLRGFRFPPSCSRAERKHAEHLLKTTLEALTGQFAGTYLHLSDISYAKLSELPDILQSIADKPTSHTLSSSGATKDWPSGRGVFYNNQATLFAWTNREDHFRVMYRDRKMDVVESFKTFCSAMTHIGNHMSENGLEFVFHKDYGYLLTCPSGIGTALRAGVHMKLPHLLKDQRFRTILKNLRLHMGAEDHDMLKKGYVDVYNMDRLGCNEEHLVQHVADSVHILVKMEKRLEKNASISDLIVTKDDDDQD